jgi:hypothetical protein
MELQGSIFDRIKSTRVYLYTNPEQSSQQRPETVYFTSSLFHYLFQLPDLGGRRICFAGHSTRGTVVKHALILAAFGRGESGGSCATSPQFQC